MKPPPVRRFRGAHPHLLRSIEFLLFRQKFVRGTLDFDKPETYAHLVVGDDLFCCLGTTIKQAGTQAAFRIVDYDYPVRFAEMARANGVKHYLMVSSIGADARSSTFYLRVKGECEHAIRSTSLDSVSVFHPSFLVGDRNEKRIGETIGVPILKILSPLLIGKLRKYKPIRAAQVAKAMLLIAQNPKSGYTVYESDEMSSL